MNKRKKKKLAKKIRNQQLLALIGRIEAGEESTKTYYSAKELIASIEVEEDNDSADTQ